MAAPAYWCPYACDADASRGGIAVEIASSAFKAAGHEVDYRNLPFDRALFEVRNGRVDSAIPTYKGEAPDFIFPQHAVSLSEYCFYVPEDESWRYTGLDSLESIRFVGSSGYSYGDDVDAYIARNREQGVALLRGSDIPDRLRKMVQFGRFEALLDDRLLFESSQSDDGLINAGCLEERHPGYLALSPEHPERSSAIAEAFEDGFERIRANGQICTILEKYGLSPRFVPSLNQDDCSQ